MKIMSVIASSTHVDRTGSRFAKSALDGMTIDIQKKYLPYLKDHDPDQLLGVLLYGEVFQLSDREYALGIVVGEYEDEDDKKKYTVGTKNYTFNLFKKYLDIENLVIGQSILSLIPDPIKPLNRSLLSLAELLALHLDTTRVNDEGQVYEIRQFVDKSDGLEIHVYPKDHPYQPHYHVISKKRGIDARFDPITHKLISEKLGKIGEKDIYKIQSFFSVSSNQKLLDNMVKKMYG